MKARIQTITLNVFSLATTAMMRGISSTRCFFSYPIMARALSTGRLIPGWLASVAMLADASCLAADVPRFQSGDRWCVLGDSITHGGSYHKYVELFYFTRYPTQQLEVVNCGISGDSAVGALKRLDWDCLEAKPTVVTVMLGMNDVGRHLYTTNAITPWFAQERRKCAATYNQSMRTLGRRLLDSGSRLVLITPSPFDDTAQWTGKNPPDNNNPGCGEALRGFASEVRTIANELGVPTIDFSGPMTALNAEQQKRDPSFTIIGPDRVHPWDPGHLVMAYEFLRAQKVFGFVSRMMIDAASGKLGNLENCEVTNLEVSTHSVSFTCLEGALPFPVEAGAMKALSYIPFTQELNQEMLLVRGLAPGQYTLSMDGKTICRYTAAQLADGVNLATQTDTPQVQQAFAVLSALRQKWDAADKLRTIAFDECCACPEAKHPVDCAEAIPKIEAKLLSLKEVPWGGYPSSLLNKYAQLKPREAELHRQVDAAVRMARENAQPRLHQYALRRADG